MTFEDQLNALIFFHLEKHTSARHLIQTLQEDDFARNNIAPEDGISRNSFSEAINEQCNIFLNYLKKLLLFQGRRIQKNNPNGLYKPWLKTFVK